MHTPNKMLQKKQKNHLSLYEMVVFAMLGTLMFCSKIVMEPLPNIHLLGMFTMVFTITFRKKALFPIYVYALITGIYAGFSMWWIPHLYLWTVLWAITMLLPKNMPKKVGCIVYPIVCALHGLAYGTLYAPTQAFFFGFDFKQTIAWIIAGLPWDAVHGLGNFCAGLLIVPLSELLKKIFAKNLIGNQ